VSGNVLNLTLRPPAVLAKAATSLDLLSHGRFEMAVGAGGFADPIHGMGGGRRTAGERVEALSEAIDIFRGVWDSNGMFREELAPALREAVATERGNMGVGRRVAGIDYDAVPAHLTAIEPGDVAYERVRHNFARKGSPGLVIQVGNVDEARAALAYARNQNVTISVRSGGHGFSGRSTNDGGIVIDLARMNVVTVLDRPTRRVRVEPGGRWGEVAQALTPHGLAISSGDFGGVGVGGLATTAGESPSSRHRRGRARRRRLLLTGLADHDEDQERADKTGDSRDDVDVVHSGRERLVDQPVQGLALTLGG
jgi:alkanesulfonate monooxygenase SsuD/methylene tetrahydromethanopterin reductase-like flavin-dependent oxidoreductase (luciferase family)